MWSYDVPYRSNLDLEVEESVSRDAGRRLKLAPRYPVLYACGARHVNSAFAGPRHDGVPHHERTNHRAPVREAFADSTKDGAFFGRLNAGWRQT